MKLCKKAARALGKYELVGLKIEVVKSPQKELVGLNGMVSDETLKTLVVSTDKGEKMLNKASVTLKVSFPGEDIVVEGRHIMQRPHERLKKIWKKM